MKSMPILEMQSITKKFGGITAVNDFSLKVNNGEILGLIGPNGAGKTTIINLITGFYKPTSGTIIFKGQDVTNMPIYQKNRLGLARTFQNIRLFKRMTVLENVLIGEQESCIHPFRSIFSVFAKAKNKMKLENAIGFLQDLGLFDQINRKAGELSYGDQRRLEIARSLATQPDILLLDEPAAGMNEEETDQLIKDIRKIKQQVKGIILVEHDLNVIRQLSGSLIAVDYGKKIVEGSPEEVLKHPVVVEAYLGGAE